ncbi:MAG: hypothetical protein J0I06_10200, partial [Planctomycetes bacterium]|nr:hypothetical protein [Planctomycetota bacterium]
MRRLLGPVGGLVTFFLIAALVFAGLGWVTVAALRVETAQREAAAQAELGNNLRVALWRLDGRMLPALGVEDSRPFYHYTSADPLQGSTAGPTPLLAAPLPDWMKLHVQLDPAAGWESPQVLSPEACARVADAWPELPLRNNTADRAAVLDAVRGKYPAGGTWEVLCARDRAAPADARPFAAPLFDPLPSSDEPSVPAPPASLVSKPPPSPDMDPVPLGAAADKASESFRLLGWEFGRRVAVDDRNAQVKKALAPAPAGPTGPQPASPPAPKTAQAPARPGVTDNDRQLNDFRTRSGTITRGVQEAKNAGQDFPIYGKGYQSNAINPGGDGKTQVPIGNGSQQLPLAPAGGVGQAPGLPVGPGGFGTSNLAQQGEKASGKDAKAAKENGARLAAGLDPTFSRPRKDGAGNERAADLLKKLQAEQSRDGFGPGGRRSDVLRDREQGDEVQRQSGASEPADAAEPAERAAAIMAAWALGVTAAGGTPAVPPRLISPGEDRPPVLANNALFNTANFNFAGPPAVSIHLGSMRPQWITASDGTETLVLVRAAKLDDKTVYQGVILDWAKLEQVLKEEVRDLFPDAKLLPVKDASNVSPDRAMTALPVQLDPGHAPAPPPPGWTPLRIGLVLAWAAALVAFAAVGFSGWSLIDLAERRIRFVSAVTHELRTPLTSLRLYLDLLMSGMIHDEAKRQEYLNTLATESDRLHRLIDNVLDFARLEKRAKNGDMKPLRVGELVDQLRATWTDRVAADGKELVVISTLSADLEVSTDAAMVHQIVGNLIDNARKYTRDAEDRRIWLLAKPDGAG